MVRRENVVNRENLATCRLMIYLLKEKKVNLDLKENQASWESQVPRETEVEMVLEDLTEGRERKVSLVELDSEDQMVSQVSKDCQVSMD